MVQETNRPLEDLLKTCPLQSHRLALRAHPVHLPAEPSPRWAQIAASCMRLNISRRLPDLPRPNQAVRHDINKEGVFQSLRTLKHTTCFPLTMSDIAARHQHQAEQQIKAL